MLHLERDARGKAEANLALCGESMSSRRRTPWAVALITEADGEEPPNFFRNSRRPVEALAPSTLASMRAVIEYVVEFDGHIDYLPTLLKSSVFGIAGVLPREWRDDRFSLSRWPPVSTSQALTRYGKSDHEPFWL